MRAASCPGALDTKRGAVPSAGAAGTGGHPGAHIRPDGTGLGTRGRAGSLNGLAGGQAVSRRPKIHEKRADHRFGRLKRRKTARRLAGL